MLIAIARNNTDVIPAILHDAKMHIDPYDIPPDTIFLSDASEFL